MGGGSSKRLGTEGKKGSLAPSRTASDSSHQGSFKLENVKAAWERGSTTDGDGALAKVATPEVDPSKLQIGDMEMQDFGVDDEVRTNWKVLADKLPIEKTSREKEQRHKLFKSWDVNGNGYLSLAELDKGIRQTSGLENLHRCKPAMMRAYEAAKTAKQGKTGGRYDDFVSRCEFRVLLVYLKLYFQLYHIFSSIDTGQDRRIDKAEFIAAADKLRRWGSAFDDPHAAFDEADANGGGHVLFDEFAAWAIEQNGKYMQSKTEDAE